MKTFWQKIYSFFGFWTYELNIPKPGVVIHFDWSHFDNLDYEQAKEYLLYYESFKYYRYRVLYWCCFPWFKFYRKFDLMKWKI